MNQFLTIAGSYLYGTNTETSDIDTRGVYLEGAEQILGLQVAHNIERKDPDTVIYPLKQFVRLALQGNPNILEVLFAPSRFWRSDDHLFFLPFINNRHAFLSQRIRETHIGYALAQLKKIEAGKSPNSNARKERIEKHGYDTKYAMHTIRLLFQGQDILLSEDFIPSVHGASLHLLRLILNGDLKREEFIEYAEQLIAGTKELHSLLPKEPNYQLVEKLLIETYREYLWHSY